MDSHTKLIRAEDVGLVKTDVFLGLGGELIQAHSLNPDLDQDTNEKDPLVQQLCELQMTITHLKADDHLEPSTFLDPFLAIIRSEDTTGPVTKSALAAVNRMLNYGLIDSTSENAVTAVEAVAAAVTHARFVGTDQGADEVVLWEILTVLRTLILGPVGHLLTNESVCEILNSSFRICFETRLSELLRNCTEDALRHMVQLLFARLPQFKDEPESIQNQKLQMRAGGSNNEVKLKRTKDKYLKPTPTQVQTPPKKVEELKSDDDDDDEDEQEDLTAVDSVVHEEPKEPVIIRTGSIELESPQENSSHDSIIGDNASIDSGIIENSLSTPVEPLDISHTHLAPDSCDIHEFTEPLVEDASDIKLNTEEICEEVESLQGSPLKENLLLENTEVRKGSLTFQDGKEFINLQGVKFTQEGVVKDGNALVPYGLPCVREVLRFLVSLISPHNEQNTTSMIHTALNLLTVALEVGAEHINKTPSLLMLVKDQLCRNLFMLIKSDARPVIFTSAIRVCTLQFESLRTHLKFQLEMFINRLIGIITSEAPNVSYAFKELSLETIVQLWRMPGLITELFLNFDCNLYASNIFEDLTKVLSKNAFPVQGLYSTNLLSLEALLTVIETIDSHCPPKPRKKIKDHLKRLDKTTAETSSVSSGIPTCLAPISSGYLLGLGLLCGYAPITPILKARASVLEDQTVCRESLLAIKEKKKLLATGTDQFNVKPEKGIQFLQDNGIMGTSYEDIAVFLKGNPHLDKNVIGEYISKKKNVSILSAFVKSFDFQGLRIDECLRVFLEAFRLPGEAPVISIIIEQFSSHWHSSNGNPFHKDDAAFTLAYAVIMLNVDQHNQNAKKQNIPMTLEQFKNNLRGVNDGDDFDPKMLGEIYVAIHTDEIVMPAEQTGLVKENYLWKMLLRRGNTKEGDYLLSNPHHTFDRDLFALCWGPTIASLSYVFDKSNEDIFIHKAISGFKKCASISARYGMSDVFDNLVVSLCKFTTLTLSSNESPEQVSISFGGNRKAQLAALTVFRLVTSHGDILKDGWKNILELLLQLFRCRLLSSSLIESEDFVEPSGKVSLLKDVPNNIPRVESSLLSSLYSYIALGDGGSARGISPEDADLMERAKTCIYDCHPEKLVTESAFLRYDSLYELLKAMMGAGDANNMADVATSPNMKLKNNACHEVVVGLDEHSQAFLLELVVSVLVANKDRAGGVWPVIRDHIYSLLMGAAAAERHFLLERCIVSVLKIAKVLLRRPELANPILQGLRMLLLLRPHVLNRVSLQVVSGIHEILSVNADHIQDPNDWAVLFALLECSGAGAKPPAVVNPEACEEESLEQVSESEGTSSGIESGQTCSSGEASDAVETNKGEQHFIPSDGNEAETINKDSAKPSRGPSPETLQNPGGWILVGREGDIEPVPVKATSVNEWDIVHQRQLGEYKPEALVKAIDTLTFLVREQHITAASLPSVVQACRTFVEATLHGVKPDKKQLSKDNVKSARRKVNRKKDEKIYNTKRPKSPSLGNNAYDADESDSEDLPISYQQVSEKLLDLMDTLHTSSSHILCRQNEDYSSKAVDPLWNQSLPLWNLALCPLLQGIARYCCDIRNSIRNLAMTYLQRALLNHDLQTLSAYEWESCFNKVLFPLLAKLLQPFGFPINGALEETRVRAATLVQKVYLRHLTPLLSLPTFTALWLTILDFMDKYLNTHKSDHLSDAIPEILKNMLLVMETTQVFHTSEGFTHLWSITWDRIDAFLPNFRHDLFRSHPPSEIHRIEVVSSEHASQSENNSGACEGSQLSGDTSVGLEEECPLLSHPECQNQEATPSMKEQEVLRLSLSQEDLPSALRNNFILHPPLPYILPGSPSSSPPSGVVEGSENIPHTSSATFSMDMNYDSSTVPCFVPQSVSHISSTQSSKVSPADFPSLSPSYLRNVNVGESSIEHVPPNSSNSKEFVSLENPTFGPSSFSDISIPIVVSFNNQSNSSTSVTESPISESYPYKGDSTSSQLTCGYNKFASSSVLSLDHLKSSTIYNKSGTIKSQPHQGPPTCDDVPSLNKNQSPLYKPIPNLFQNAEVSLSTQPTGLPISQTLFHIAMPFFNNPFTSDVGIATQPQSQPLDSESFHSLQNSINLPKESSPFVTDHSLDSPLITADKCLLSDKKVAEQLPFRPASLLFTKSSTEEFPVSSTMSPEFPYANTQTSQLSKGSVPSATKTDLQLPNEEPEY